MRYHLSKLEADAITAKAKEQGWDDRWTECFLDDVDDVLGLLEIAGLVTISLSREEAQRVLDVGGAFEIDAILARRIRERMP